MQTQTSNTLHNAIMEAGSKDRPPMLAPGSPVTTTEPYMETYKTVLQDIRDQLNDEAKAVQIILTGIDNDIYSTVDACSNSQELKTVSLHKLYDILKQHQNEVNEIRAERIARNVVGARETVGTTVVQKSGIQCYNFKEFRHVARECQKPKRVKDAAYHREKMLLCKQEEAGIQLNAEQADWRDDTDDESEDHELKEHYMYMAQIQEVSPDAVDFGPIFDSEPVQKNDDDNDLANERELLASLIKKLKCEIDDSKNRNKFLETSNKVLIEQLKGEIEDFKNQNKSLESSNNRFKEANNKLSKTNKLLYNDFKKSQAELQKRNDVEYALKVEIDCAKAKGDLISYKLESQKSFNKYTQTINDLNQTISEMKKKLSAHQETISILSQQKEAQIKLYKTRKDKELDKVTALENKVKFLDNIVIMIILL
nr:hypothetical protein [Tanacetum cinerariifolium]